MRVLMLTTNSSLLDGINRHILNVATQLKKMGLEVAVCTVHERGELHVELEKAHVATYSLNAANGHKPSIIPRYNKVLRSFQPTIVHVHVMALMERIVAATLYRGKKYVLTIHGISDKVEHRTLRMRVESALDSIFRVPVGAYIFISDGVRQKLMSKAHVYNQVIYNPISFDTPSAPDSTLYDIIGVGKDTPIIGTSCRIAAVKQPTLFTEVMCKVLAANPQAHAVVIGDGDTDLINKSKAIVDSYNLNDRFHWLGFRKDAPQLVADMSCFVMTSVSEGMPTSILECMASKTPFVIMQGDGGLKDLEALNSAEGPFTVLVKPGDSDAMASAISEIITDKAVSEALVAQSNVVGLKHFSIASVCNQIVELYKHIS